VVLRVREPNLPRAFRVPGGLIGAVVVGILPMALLAAAVLSSTAAYGGALAAGLSLAYLGPLMYWARLRLHRGDAPRA
jgi:hypothetical protein